MLDFIRTGRYYMYPLLASQYPRLTIHDLHAHAYLIADKYSIPALAVHAANNYLSIAADTLSLKWGFDDPDYYDTSLSKPPPPSLHTDHV